jgi:hypothetical protein
LIVPRHLAVFAFHEIRHLNTMLLVDDHLFLVEVKLIVLFQYQHQ